MPPKRKKTHNGGGAGDGKEEHNDKQRSTKQARSSDSDSHVDSPASRLAGIAAAIISLLQFLPIEGFARMARLGRAWRDAAASDLARGSLTGELRLLAIPLPRPVPSLRSLASFIVWPLRHAARNINLADATPAHLSQLAAALGVTPSLDRLQLSLAGGAVPLDSHFQLSCSLRHLWFGCERIGTAAVIEGFPRWVSAIVQLPHLESLAFYLGPGGAVLPVAPFNELSQMKSLRSLKQFDSLTELDVMPTASQFTMVELDLITKHNRLSHLKEMKDICALPITPQLLEYLLRVPSLCRFEFRNCLAPSTLRLLAQFQRIEYLFICEPLPDAPVPCVPLMEALQCLPHIEALRLHNINFTGQQLASFLPTLHKLHSLHLIHMRAFHDLSFLAASPSLPSTLTCLELRDCYDLKPSSLETLMTFRKLKQLTLAGSLKLSPASVTRMTPASPSFAKSDWPRLEAFAYHQY